MDAILVRANERAFLKILDKDDCLVSGLSLYRKNDKKPVSRSPERVKKQIELIRRMGIHGYCLFVSGYLDDKIVDMLRHKENTEPAKPWFR
jgi:hypothetical protein